MSGIDLSSPYTCVRNTEAWVVDIKTFRMLYCSIELVREARDWITQCLKPGQWNVFEAGTELRPLVLMTHYHNPLRLLSITITVTI